MKAIRLLLIEDTLAEADQLRAHLESCGYEVVAVADRLDDALDAFYRELPDLVLSDILLGNRKDGIAFAERMNETPDKVRPVIFLTGLVDGETARSARAVRPFSYLLKPYNHLELQYAIELALEQFAARAGVFAATHPEAVLLFDHFFVRRGQYLVKLAMRDIRYVMVEHKYSTIVSNDGKFLVQMAIKELLAQLPATDFVRIHRNYAVGMAFVRRIDVVDNLVELSEGQVLPISREYKKVLLKRMPVF